MVKAVRDDADWYIVMQIDLPRISGWQLHTETNINVISGIANFYTRVKWKSNLRY